MTDQERKAIEMALDVLDYYVSFATGKERGFTFPAIQALRQALAQPEQFQLVCKKCGADRTKDDCKGERIKCGIMGEAQSAQPEQEPVCTKIEGNQFETFKVRYEDAVKLKNLPVGTKLYTAPPSKPCAITDLLRQKFQSGNNVPVERITITRSEYEAALKEKNT